MRILFVTLACLIGFVLFAVCLYPPPASRNPLQVPTVHIAFPSDQQETRFQLVPESEVRVELPEPMGRVVALRFVRFPSGTITVLEDLADGNYQTVGLRSDGTPFHEREWNNDYRVLIKDEVVVLQRRMVK